MNKQQKLFLKDGNIFSNHIIMSSFELYKIYLNHLKNIITCFPLERDYVFIVTIGEFNNFTYVTYYFHTLIT